MHSPKLFRIAVTGLGLAFALAGCGPAATGGGSGGSSSASGGSSGSGGSGSGGTTTGSGGATNSSGGATGSGGSASGGASSSGGGATATGGSGSGGLGSGGSSGTGGGAATGGAPNGGGRGGSGSGGAGGSSGGTFTLTSPTHMEGAKFGTKFTCAAMNGTFGSGVNPELNWSGVPENTRSFVITFIDTKLGESSPMGQHWAAWNIPAAVRKLPEGTTTLTGDLMGAKQTNKYLSPCPSGNDTYEFTVYALSADALSVTGAEGSGASNSAGVAKVLAALKMVTPLGAAKLRGTSGPMGN
jgi:Raf kinase inhibitor-like YbhB/YbcL family protein